MTAKPTVAVVGDTRVPAGSAQARLLEEVGRVLVRHGCRIQTGGLGDLPRLVAEGARSEPGYQAGDLLALVPGFDPADGYADIVIPTGLDLGRNALVANAEIVIAVGGGAGTLSEIALAWQMGRPIVAWTGGGWSAKVANTTLDHRRADRIAGFAEAYELPTLLQAFMGRRYPRHPGIRLVIEVGEKPDARLDEAAPRFPRVRADAPAWVLPAKRFNDIAWIDARVEAAPQEARGGLRTALRYLYADDGPHNLPLDRFRDAESHLDEVERRAARWMKTRTNGSGRKHYGTASILAARRARFRCEECGHDDVRTLQIDHVDGRHGETALRCLCANCHQVKSHGDSAKRNAARVAHKSGP